MLNILLIFMFLLVSSMAYAKSNPKQALQASIDSLINQFKMLGGDAIEVVSGSQRKDENLSMAKHVLDFELAVSADSDYHGPEKLGVQPGKIPDPNYLCQSVREAGLIPT